MPWPVSLIIAPHHGDELLVPRDRSTGSCVTGAEILRWSLLMIWLYMPVIPPTDIVKCCKISTVKISSWRNTEALFLALTLNETSKNSEENYYSELMHNC